MPSRAPYPRSKISLCEVRAALTAGGHHGQARTLDQLIAHRFRESEHILRRMFDRCGAQKYRRYIILRLQYCCCHRRVARLFERIGILTENTAFADQSDILVMITTRSRGSDDLDEPNLMDASVFDEAPAPAPAEIPPEDEDAGYLEEEDYVVMDDDERERVLLAERACRVLAKLRMQGHVHVVSRAMRAHRLAE